MALRSDVIHHMTLDSSNFPAQGPVFDTLSNAIHTLLLLHPHPMYRYIGRWRGLWSMFGSTLQTPTWVQ